MCSLHEYLTVRAIFPYLKLSSQDSLRFSTAVTMDTSITECLSSRFCKDWSHHYFVFTTLSFKYTKDLLLFVHFSTRAISQNHRMAPRTMKFQPPYHRQGWQLLDQVLDQAAHLLSLSRSLLMESLPSAIVSNTDSFNTAHLVQAINKHSLNKVSWFSAKIDCKVFIHCLLSVLQWDGELQKKPSGTSPVLYNSLAYYQTDGITSNIQQGGHGQTDSQSDRIIE